MFDAKEIKHPSRSSSGQEDIFFTPLMPEMWEPPVRIYNIKYLQLRLLPRSADAGQRKITLISLVKRIRLE